MTFAGAAVFEPLHHRGGSRGLRRPAGDKVVRGSCGWWPGGCRSHPENLYLSGSSARPDHSPGPYGGKRPASHASSPSTPPAGCPAAVPGLQLGLGPRDWLRLQTAVCSWRQGQWGEKGHCDLPPGGADVSVSLGVAQRGVSGREDECPGGAGRPLLQTSPRGAQAPGAAPRSLVWKPWRPHGTEK